MAAGPTLGALLAQPDLGLLLATPQDGLDPAASDRPVRWVHSSDLVDPTPFLADDCVLLTTGTQFTGPRPIDAEEYVARLAARGVLALGFGTEVVRDGVPDPLAAACRAAGMPLFEVPYRTPFIAVVRANAEAVAAEAYARRSWALAAQHALALAALHDDGLAATLAELARQLGSWVGQYDTGGDAVRQFPAALDAATAAAVREEAQTLLRRGGQASSATEAGGRRFTLQTLGGTRPLGVIAIGADALDHEARGVVTAVVAMAGLALEQSRGIRRADAALRTGALRALLGGDEEVARDIVAGRFGPLPPAPVRVVAVEPLPSQHDAVVDWLERRAARTRGASFWAGTPEGIVVLVGDDDAGLADDLSARFDLAAGMSEPVLYADATRARQEAAAALERGMPGVTRFADVAASGLLAALESDGARMLAEPRIAPLRRHDAEHGTQLEETVRTWLAHDARLDAAAEALGVHRHTVRARIALAERVLGADLGGFPARAELWAALQLATP